MSNRRLVVFGLQWALVACSSSSSTVPAATNDADTGPVVAKFTCNDAESSQCDLATEYCIEIAATGVVGGTLCVPLPAGCSSCDCAQSDAPNAEMASASGGTDCSASSMQNTLSCTGDSKTGITVTCSFED